MSELAYFSLGWTSYNISEYLDNKEDPSKNDYVKDAIEILTDFTCIESTKSMIKQYSSDRKYKPNILTPLILDLFKDKRLEEIVTSLKDDINVLNEFKKTGSLSETERNKLKELFSDVSKLSKKYSDYVIRTRSFKRHNDRRSLAFV